MADGISPYLCVYPYQYIYLSFFANVKCTMLRFALTCNNGSFYNITGKLSHMAYMSHSH